MIKFLYVLASIFTIVALFSIINLIRYLFDGEFLLIEILQYLAEILFFSFLSFISYFYIKKLKKRESD